MKPLIWESSTSRPTLQDAARSGQELAGDGGAIVRNLTHDEPHDALLIDRRVPGRLEVELARRDQLDRAHEPPVGVARSACADPILAVAGADRAWDWAGRRI